MNELSFGEWLSRQRKSLGLTQKQIAERIHCATITVRKLEAEQRRPSVQIVEQLAEVLNIPAAEHDAFLRYARGDGQSLPSLPMGNLPWHTLVGSLPEDRSSTLVSFLEDKRYFLLGNNDPRVLNTQFVTFSGLSKIENKGTGLAVGQGLFPMPHAAAYIMVLVPIEIAVQVIPSMVQSYRDNVRFGKSTLGLPNDPIAIHGVYIVENHNFRGPGSSKH